MKSQSTLPLLACGLALLALPAFANDHHDSAAKLKLLDTDGDGRISRAEFLAGKQAKFDKLDTNHDGMVSADEKATAKSEKKHWWSRNDKADKINKADANNDNQISASEESSSAEAMFTKLDTNGDGFLTAAELDAGAGNGAYGDRTSTYGNVGGGTVGTGDSKDQTRTPNSDRTDASK